MGSCICISIAFAQCERTFEHRRIARLQEKLELAKCCTSSIYSHRHEKEQECYPSSSHSHRHEKEQECYPSSFHSHWQDKEEEMLVVQLTFTLQEKEEKMLPVDHGDGGGLRINQAQHEEFLPDFLCVLSVVVQILFIQQQLWKRRRGQQNIF